MSQNSDPSSRVQTVRLWFKSFIPFDLEGALSVPAGPHVGKTMLPSPGPIDAWFLTDGREFSLELGALARMHSEVELDFVNFSLLRELHKCDPTVQVDHKTGEELCCEVADIDNMAFADFKFSSRLRTMSMSLKGSTKNACLKLGSLKISPNLDYEGDISLRLHDNECDLTVVFEGKIETYPAFEMYVTVNDGSAVPVFQMPVEPDATPLSLIGPPQRSVNQSVTVSCRPA